MTSREVAPRDDNNGHLDLELRVQISEFCFLFGYWNLEPGIIFLKATACAKVVNLAADSGAVVYFLPAGAILWKLAIPMAVSAFLGGLVGARLVMMGGNVWIRRVFLVLSATLLIKLTLDYFI